MLIGHLKTELADRCRKNPRYSLRAFSKALELDPGTLSSLMNGRRPLTFKTAMHIVQRLNLSESKRRRLLVGSINGYSGQTVPEYKLLKEDVFAIIGSWEHFAVLSLLQTKSCMHTASWMARRLAVPIGVIIGALERLEKVGLIKKVGSKWVVLQNSVATSNDIPSPVLRQAHWQYIQKALFSLEHDPVEIRDITGITVATSTKKLKEAKRWIMEFRRSLCEFLEDGDSDEVYRVNIQFFPITRKEKA